MLIHPDNPDTSTEPGGGRSHCGPWSRLLPRPGPSPTILSGSIPFRHPHQRPRLGRKILLSCNPACPPSSSETGTCLLCLPASLRLTVCVYSACRPTVGHDKQRSGGFKSARGDPDSFDLHSAKITMSASSGCRLDSCVLRLKSQLTGGMSRCCA